MIAFISGGARSGKSTHAEALARRWQAERGGARYYLATARSGSDGEWQARIGRHRQARGEGWITLEEPVDLVAALEWVAPGSTLLLDCLTLWASQLLYASEYAGELDEARGIAMLERLLAEARRRDVALVIVSNDVNEGMPPEDAEVWRYLAFLQRAHRLVAKEADEVIQVMAGLPQVWKRRGGERS
ncbi:bifunctional adenosylcobinamide kinase/adenosylcobinamide-phosphate guanylyltransferase [Halomonas sp. MCCC 1A17488]|uniref:bifunctional adenosylcobinamide kinase/adenosylcobinamide-phosphate guanylyltransferase n=1 Tax=unclassified Halomonas TaxID=2609666 RepID=UPI0018D24538|nr:MULTISPECIES: bifunctional adenosylcobinamide kinase/adenosylcobinamide-phosphate guanylyltransferase [unclassified Halomonas]MCE8014539.1 bifunctional adenosylcobinamide kinase/adenosylcobinamide-phosphate guanylyltransferase [Halomonas sp. MCCC 1A17488]MCG3237872.1 bifunctional adenosylcobinamide kinase/adenosylcobinamide-phosphate guanylyltransferase [Halomonas sp. MCCC 1A17488]QPP48336.1 bifunctional adenosylcobinamide kinase/adenosylcobinamide-phosphate guanylyltransferase [Halomonas sp.